MVGVLLDAAGVLANDNAAARECFAATIDRTYGTEIPRHPRALLHSLHPLAHGPTGSRPGWFQGARK
jgi:hypothetical protein